MLRREEKKEWEAPEEQGQEPISLLVAAGGLSASISAPTR